ncbi:hypothetical protein [Mucilaginibacter flavus]|nr:hypothetical protein [Mucilaginibacter flavus]MDN3584672.1 hypothetical protein [Mucilaginibacter flavus]
MKAFFYLIATAFISVGAFMTAVNQEASTILYITAFSDWVLFGGDGGAG